MPDPLTLPKAELHIHLEGAMRIGTLRELADRDGRPLPAGLGADGWGFSGFLDFIEQYVALCGAITRLDDFRRLGVEVCQDLERQGVRYAEAVFTPSVHAATFDDDWYGPIEAMLDGLESGRRDTGVLVRLTPDVVRDLGLGAAQRTLEVAKAYADRGVVGLNCAGSERTVVAPFGAIFRAAKEAGLRSVPHAGEWAGPDNVWQTLDALAPDRIGHGVRAIEDPRLVEHLASAGIPLDVSPVSNLATGVYPSLDRHPFPRLRAAGVVVTLNSDDPVLFGAWVGEVYRIARDAWGFTDGDLADIARAGVRASFADEELKSSLLRDIDAWLLEPVPQARR